MRGFSVMTVIEYLPVGREARRTWGACETGTAVDGYGFYHKPISCFEVVVIDGKATTLDIAALRLSRFSENDPVKTPYSYGVMG